MSGALTLPPKYSEPKEFLKQAEREKKAKHEVVVLALSEVAQVADFHL